MTVRLVLEWVCEDPACPVTCVQDATGYPGGVAQAAVDVGERGYLKEHGIAPKGWRWSDGKLLCPWCRPGGES